MTNTQEHGEVRKWLEAWYAVGDQCIPPNSIKWFAEDCVVQFNNSPPVQGKEAAQSEFSKIAPAIHHMSHQILNISISGTKIYNECNVTYVAKGDPELKPVTMHRLNVYDREPGSGLITLWQAYFDPSPLKERMALSKTGAKGYS